MPGVLVFVGRDMPHWLKKTVNALESSRRMENSSHDDCFKGKPVLSIVEFAGAIFLGAQVAGTIRAKFSFLTSTRKNPRF
jgi:hypothetical protein